MAACSIAKTTSLAERGGRGTRRRPSTVAVQRRRARMPTPAPSPAPRRRRRCPMPSPAPNGAASRRCRRPIRTLALVGPAAAGKTSLAEALLHRAGAIAAPGSLERGSTVSDFDPLERRMQHSLNAAVMHLQHAGTRVHLIDTPGRAGFRRPVAAGAGGGGDRGDRHQRRQRHRADGRAHDGLRGAAPPRPPDHRQQDRRPGRRPGRRCWRRSRPPSARNACR